MEQIFIDILNVFGLFAFLGIFYGILVVFAKHAEKINSIHVDEMDLM